MAKKIIEKTNSNKMDKGLSIEKISSVSDMQPGENRTKDAYKEYGCEYMNEDECKENLDEDVLDSDKVEKEHFDDDRDIKEEEAD